MVVPAAPGVEPFALVTGATLAAAACTDAFEPSGMASPPDSVVAKGVDMRSVTVSWTRPANAAGYLLQRRANLTGGFVTVRLTV